MTEGSVKTDLAHFRALFESLALSSGLARELAAVKSSMFAC
jgi:hypothetical protein